MTAFVSHVHLPCARSGLGLSGGLACGRRLHQYGAVVRARRGMCTRRRAPVRTVSASAAADVNGSSAGRNGGRDVDSVLRAMRAELARRGLDAFIVPSGDPHASEYSAARFGRRAFVSKFTGSAGTAVVTESDALLWTDGRYFLQAAQQLGPDWTLMRAGLPGTPSVHAHLAATLPEGAKVGVDALMHSIAGAAKLHDTLKATGKSLVPIEGDNPVDVVWGDDQPAMPTAPIRVHPMRFAGVSSTEKLATLREHIISKNCDALLVSSLDEVCWLLNIRGSDVPHCPVVIAYALVTANDGIFLYVDPAKVANADASVREALDIANVVVRDYTNVVADVMERNPGRIWLDPSSTSLALSTAAGDNALVETTPIALAKALKNAKELAAMREAHIRDAAALCSFLSWLEARVNGPEGDISEVDAAAKLREFRASQEGFIDTSFDTIAGSGPNGAIIHYSASPDTCSSVNNREVFLLDSGGQYEDGTTDVTRTMHLGGTASRHERECFTRVLQGHIAVDSAVFPSGTTGLMLDAFARAPLWSMGLEYRHGTGHGVGACLNVHEGPQSISPRVGSNKVSLQEGMIVSNEPGYYEDGKFGIRIENLVTVVRKDTKHKFDGGTFLGFDHLTHVPIDKSMVLPELLSSAEVSWLDAYHDDVWRKVGPRLPEGSSEREWLFEKTRPLLAAVPSVPAHV